MMMMMMSLINLVFRNFDKYLPRIYKNFIATQTQVRVTSQITNFCYVPKLQPGSQLATSICVSGSHLLLILNPWLHTAII